MKRGSSLLRALLPALLVAAMLVPMGAAVAAENPSVQATLDPATPDGDNDWYVSPVSLTLSSDDDAAELRWREAGDEDWVDYTDSVAFGQDGNYEVEYQAVAPGEPGPTTADVVAGPGGQDIFDPANVTVEVDGTVTYTREAGFHNVEVRDSAGNVIDESEMNSTWETWEFTPTEPGDYTFVCIPHESQGMVGTLTVLPAADGVESEVGTVSFDLDQTAPATDANLSGVTSGGAYIETATVTLDAQDPHAGVAATEYRVDGGATESYTDPVDFAGAGAYTIEFRSTDNAGNVEDWQSVTFEIVEEDPNAPSVTASLDPAAPNGENGWYTSPVELTLSSDTEDASLLYRRADVDSWSLYGSPVTFTRDGNYDLQYRGVTGWDAPSHVDVEVGAGGNFFTPDAIAVTEGGTITYERVNGRHNVVTVDAEGNEIATSGAPGNDWDTYTFDVPDEAGTYYIYCAPHADTSDPDPANWTRMVGSVTVLPAGDPTDVDVNVGDDGRNFNPDEITVTEGGTITYSLVAGRHNVVTVDPDGDEIDTSGAPANDWDTYTFDVPDGTGTYYVYCAPHANTSDPDPANWTGMVARVDVVEPTEEVEPEVSSLPREISFNLDQAAPRTTAVVDGEAADTEDVFLDQATVNLNATDATSGVAQTQWRTEGETEYEVYEDALTFVGAGSSTVEYRSVDNAGNVEDWKTVVIEIESSLPVCELNQGSASFPDAPGSGHQYFIDCLAALEIVGGFDDGTYRPASPVTRGQLASFVVRAIETITGTTLEAGGELFPDVSPGSTHGQAIYKLRNAGVIQGYTDGTFRPAADVSRDQTARYVVNALESQLGEELPTSGARFPDVTSSQYVDDIDKLVTAEIIGGFTDGTFGPRLSVTRGQMARFIGNSLDLLPTS